MFSTHEAKGSCIYCSSTFGSDGCPQQKSRRIDGNFFVHAIACHGVFRPFHSRSWNVQIGCFLLHRRFHWRLSRHFIQNSWKEGSLGWQGIISLLMLVLLFHYANTGSISKDTLRSLFNLIRFFLPFVPTLSKMHQMGGGGLA